MPLSCMMVTVLLICDAVAFKAVTIFHLHIAASGLVFPLSFLIACIITEVYGYGLSGRVIWIQLLCSFAFILIVNALVIPGHENANNLNIQYYEIYHNYWRVILGTIAGTPLAYFITDILISKVKILLKGKLFILRYIVANVVGKFLLVGITYPINFYNVYPMEAIIKIILGTWLFKVAAAFVLSPLAIIISNKVKKIERLDTFDYGISYNPALVFRDTSQGSNQYHKD